jgi:hypothetical protein
MYDLPKSELDCSLKSKTVLTRQAYILNQCKNLNINKVTKIFFAMARFLPEISRTVSDCPFVRLVMV